MVLNVPEIPPKVAGIVTLSGGGGGGPGKTNLSLFKYVTIRLGRARIKGKSDDVTLYEFFVTVSLINLVVIFILGLALSIKFVLDSLRLPLLLLLW